MVKINRFILGLFLIYFFSDAIHPKYLIANEVNVYTSRHYDTDENLYKIFRDKTEIKVNILSGKGKALIERLRSEKNNSPPDVLITVDAGSLWKLQQDGFFLINILGVALILFLFLLLLPVFFLLVLRNGF